MEFTIPSKWLTNNCARSGPTFVSKQLQCGRSNCRVERSLHHGGTKYQSNNPDSLLVGMAVVSVVRDAHHQHLGRQLIIDNL